MGLLDDAIKEHLELKRKHGAAEEELRRQETEALGPARRDFSTAEAAADEPAVAALPSDDAAAGYEPEPPPEPAGWLEEVEPPAVAEAPAPPAPAPPEVPVPEPPAPEPAAPEPLEHAAEATEPALTDAPVPAPDPAPARRTSDTPTQGFDALSLDDEDAEGPPEEDVLEETPDFLQDTPEHDRLWFEQKPPRDFDFDD